MEKEIVTVPHWANSAGGKPIALHHSIRSETRPLLFIGGVHGDEPEGVALAEATLSWLRREYSRGELNSVKVSWLLIACWNVDGFGARHRGNANGVDLNRNFPSSNWSSESKTARYYPGPSAGSEPETQALIKLIAQYKPGLIIHCHSWQPCIVMTGPAGLKDAQRLAQASGYSVKDEIGYPTPGALSQFGWHDSKIPVICIEAQEHSDIATVWPKFKSGIQEIFRDGSER